MLFYLFVALRQKIRYPCVKKLTGSVIIPVFRGNKMKYSLVVSFLSLSILASFAYAATPGLEMPIGGQGTLEGAGSPTVPVTTAPAPAPSPSAPPPKTPEQLKAEYDAKTGEQLRKTYTQAANEELFKKDKAKINSILNGIMAMIESNRAGPSKVRTAAARLRDLMNVHAFFPLGSDHKMAQLEKLEDVVATNLEAIQNEKKFKFDLAGTKKQITELRNLEKMDGKILSLLEDYYLEKAGYFNARGLQITAAGLVGVKVGIAAGNLVSATGKRYPTICPTVSGVIGVGVAGSATHIQGNTKLKRNCISISGEENPMAPVFVKGTVTATDAQMGENGLKFKEHIAGPILEAGSMGFSNTFRLGRFPGRNYKYLRERLGLVANPQ